MNKRIFIERKTGFDIEREELIKEFSDNFQVNLPKLRYLIGYDVFDIEKKTLDTAIKTVFSEANKDITVDNLEGIANYLAYEYLPGQFDQRADSATQCIKLISPHENPTISSFTVIIFDQYVDNLRLDKIKKYLINSVESRVKNLDIMQKNIVNEPQDVAILKDFITRKDLHNIHSSMSLAMSLADLKFIQDYFKAEGRNPSITEIKVLDTYWSDHCRHTSFETELENINFAKGQVNQQIKSSFQDYLKTRKLLGRSHLQLTLMDLATINSRYERNNQNLNDLEISEEINAASIHINVETDQGTEPWLLMFKNETHNHPTEIEPFGGASTCIGGAIRDPLSGRSYVYQAMRITGAGDITADIETTLPGKLPQVRISKQAAHGYSSYGNQIGLATSFVKEIYHPGYLAKRMEVGVVVAAAKLENVIRKSPVAGDLVIMLGGKTGRDGIGGATGSSKTHNIQSLETSFAEVQKGNAPEERKIQRLFRNPEVARMIKKSNDFGAGGVSVAVGELARGIDIDLDKLPTKYQGINGTELAISESQERMAVVIDKANETHFIELCNEENIEAERIAVITDKDRLRMSWRGKIICDIARDFIDTSGVRQMTDVLFKTLDDINICQRQISFSRANILKHLQDLNIAENQGLVEMFDSTIGRTTVLAPYGGTSQLTKTQLSVHKIPVLKGDTSTVSLLSYGFNPDIATISPYHGSSLAIIEAMSKIVAGGGDYQKIRFTFQEYFERMTSPEKWSKPLASLLGAYQTLKDFNLAAIGGKDSMSGSYNDIHVPPSLIAFAVTTEHIDNIISPEFKRVGSFLYLVKAQNDERNLPDIKTLKENYQYLHLKIREKCVISAYALEYGGLAEALTKCSFGNQIACDIETDLDLFNFDYGSILIEATCELDYGNLILLGKTNNRKTLTINRISFTLSELLFANQVKFNAVYPVMHQDQRIWTEDSYAKERTSFDYPKKVKNVKVLLPIFPGTNCEYDSAAAFEKLGATIIPFVFKNQTESDIMESIDRLAEKISEVEIIMFSGGFSSGDEPDGSGKFIANVLRNHTIKKAIHRFLESKKLILGICNGFQALVKSGLLPHGQITETSVSDPLLFKNSINRHISKFVKTKVSSVNSPWLSGFSIDQTHTIPISHGEGRFVIDEKMYQDLARNNQIAFQYVDDEANPTYNPQFNPNGSDYAIEGIISKDGLILGKMGHSERYEENLYKNIPNISQQNIFINAINYFKGKE